MQSGKRVLGSFKNKIAATELLEERANCNFDQDELKEIYLPLSEGREIAERVRADCENDPKLAKSHKYYEYSPEEENVSWMKKMNYIWFNKDRKFYMKGATVPNYYWAFNHQGQALNVLHENMFTESLMNFSDEEQYKKWVNQAKNWDIHGCYAQTEIGHGSDFASLQTTATFNKDTDEFIINTPTITATKWWPGEMGRIANFALVFARLIIPDDGESNDFGVVPFIVQVRDRNTHKHMPGVKSGDMGPKYGYHGKDNGWMTFQNVRIPRSQLLQKYLKVDRDGTFSLEGDLRALYVTMMNVRFQIFSASRFLYPYMLTIAIRYSICRRQFKNIDGVQEETQLLDYQTQQMKLFPLLASSFAYTFTTTHVKAVYDQLLQGMKNDDYSLLDLIHHFTSGMKSVFSQDGFDALISIRQSLGGAGYSGHSGLPFLIAQYSPTVTFEGDNTVMAQQAFNFLLQQGSELMKGKKKSVNDEAFEYLDEIN